MRLAEIHHKGLAGVWCHDEPSYDPDFSSQADVLNAFRPSVRVSLCPRQDLKEATYRELMSMIDPDFLNQGIRASQLKGIRLFKQVVDGRSSAFDPADTMNFLIDSSEHEDNRISYLNQVKFDDWDDVGQQADLKYNERARLMLWAGNIRVHCTCPSFLFWGYQYLLTVMDAAIYPEPRQPHVRNPQEFGIVCKHLNRILRVLGAYNGDIASELKAQFGE